LVLTGLRQLILRALPLPLKLAIGAGIGLFLFAIGAYEGGLFTVPPYVPIDGGGVRPPDTAGTLGSFLAPATLFAIFGLVLTAALMRASIKGALLIGILLTTIVGVALHLALRLPLSTVPGKLELPPQLVSAPDFSVMGAVFN